MEAEDLLQKHGLLEGDIAAQSERVEALNAAALRFSQLQGESGIGFGEETFKTNAVRSLMTFEREKEGVGSLSLEASKHRLGSHCTRDTPSG